MKNIAVFASGRGSNFEQLCIAEKSGKLPAKIVVLIASKNGIGAIEIAEQYNIPWKVFNTGNYANRSEYNTALLSCLSSFNTDFIALAGWLKLIDKIITDKYRDKIVNIHPALLPFFGGKGMYGINVHKAVWQSGMRVSGATVHIVDAEYDHGRIIAQKCVQLTENETPETIAKKVLEIEHSLYPEALQLLVEKKI